MSMEKFKELLGDIGAELGNRVTEAKEMLGTMKDEIGAELKHQAEAGSHELAAALFRGDGFVMYPHAGKEAEGHGLPAEAVKAPEVQQEMERGGRE